MIHLSMHQNKLSAWRHLEVHAKNNGKASQADEKNVKTRVLTSCDLSLTYTHQQLTDETLRLLIALAHACDLQKKIDALMRGDILNTTEKRPALHTALRAPDGACIMLDGQNIMDWVFATRHQMKQISDKIRAKQWLGYS